MALICLAVQQFYLKIAFVLLACFLPIPASVNVQSFAALVGIHDREILISAGMMLRSH